MATLRELLEAKGDETTLKAITRMKRGTQLLESDEHDTAVSEALARVNKRGRNKSHRPSSSSGPITPEEFHDLLNADQTVAEILGNAQFVEGIRFYIAATTKGERYQVALGEFISKYEQQSADVQDAIRVALTGNSVVKARFEDKAKSADGSVTVTVIEQLAEVLFFDDEIAWEKSGNRQLKALRRIGNWKAAYEEANGIQRENSKSVDAQKRLEAGRPSIEDLPSESTISVLNAPSARAENIPMAPRKSTYTVVADMYWQVGTGNESAMTIEKQTELRSAIIRYACNTGLDSKKIEAARLQFEPLSTGLVEKQPKQVIAEPTALDVMEALKATVKATKTREATEVETETVA